MTNTHIRKIMADIMARKGRTALVSTSIFVGVVGVITLFTVRNLISNQLSEDLKQEQIAMIDVLVSVSEQSEDNDQAALTRLRNLPELSTIEGRAIYPLLFAKPGSRKFETAELYAYSVPLQEVQLEPMRLVEGQWAVPGNRQIMLERRMADQYGFAVGDKIAFRPRESDNHLFELNILRPRNEVWTISGTVFHPYSYRAPSIFGGFTPGPTAGVYAQYADAKALLGFAGYSNIVARYNDFNTASTNFEAFQHAIIDQTGYEPILPILENPAANQQLLNAENFNNVLTMLSIIAMLVSGLLVINVIHTTIVEQKTQIGSMKAIGASSSDIFKIYLGIAFAYGCIGTGLAILPAIWLGNLSARNLATQLDVLLEEFGWSPVAILIGIVMGIVVPVISAIVPVYSGVRLSILEALMDRGIRADYQLGFLGHLTRLLPLPMIVKQAVSNLVREKGRLALTGFTLTSAVAAFMGVTAVGMSLTNVTQDIFARLGYEALVIPNQVFGSDRAIQAMETLDEVKTAYRGTLVAVQLQGDYENFFTGDNQIVIFGLDPATTVFDFHYEAGSGWETDSQRSGAVISSSLAEQLDAEVGSEIMFVVQGKQITTSVIGIDTVSLDAMWMRWDEVSQLLGLITPTIDGSGGQPLSNGYYVKLSKTEPSAKEVDQALEAIDTSLKAEGFTVQTTRNQVEQNVETTRFINQNIGILNLSAALIALVGGIGLLTTLAMSVFERQKEIGVMRAIGAASPVIITQFLTEGLLIGITSWLIAIPFSYGLALAINQTLNLDTIKFTYPVEVLMLGMGGMLTIAMIASIGPSLTAANKTVSNIIRYQ